MVLVRATNRLLRTAVVATLMLTAVVSIPAVALVPPPPPSPSIPGPDPISGSPGVGGVGGFIGFVGFLVIYDLIRRISCSGDFLGLGGPGFDKSITAGENVLPPQCKPILRVKG